MKKEIARGITKLLVTSLIAAVSFTSVVLAEQLYVTDGNNIVQGIVQYNPSPLNSIKSNIYCGYIYIYT